jgi:hypothetical protein
LFLRNISAVVCLGFALSCAPQSAARPGSPAGPAAGNRVIGEYIAVLKPGTNAQVILTGFADLGAHNVSKIDTDTYLFRVRTDPGPDAMNARAAAQPDIVRIQPNFVYRQI